MERVERWLDDLKRDLETPDPWAELLRKGEMLEGSADEAVENTPFTPEEQAEIVKLLREIKKYSKKTYSLSEESLLTLEKRLDYLEEAASRVGRKDWVLLFLGTLFTLVVTTVLPPEAVRGVLAILGTTIGHLFGHTIPPTLLGG